MIWFSLDPLNKHSVWSLRYVLMDMEHRFHETDDPPTEQAMFAKKSVGTAAEPRHRSTIFRNMILGVLRPSVVIEPCIRLLLHIHIQCLQHTMELHDAGRIGMLPPSYLWYCCSYLRCSVFATVPTTWSRYNGSSLLCTQGVMNTLLAFFTWVASCATPTATW